MTRRPPPIAAALLLALAATAGQVRAQTVPPPPRTAAQLAALIAARANREVDLVNDARAIASDATADTEARNRLALQNCLSAGRLAGRPDRTTRIRIRGDVAISRPDWCADNIEILGEPGTGARLRVADGNGNGPLIAMPLNPGGKALGPANFPDAFRVLDTSAAPRAGARHGIRTFLDTHFVDPAGPLAFGQTTHYGLDCLTVECKLDTRNAGVVANCSLGFGVPGDNKPGPWQIKLAADGGRPTFLLGFRTVANGATIIDEGQIYTLHIPRPSVPGVIDLRLTIDVANAEIHAWVDRVKVAVPAIDHPTWQAGNGRHLQTNEDSPFGFGAALGGSALSQYWADDKADVTLWGVRVSRGRPYDTTGAIGSMVTRADGEPTDDLHSFFSWCPGCLAYLPLDDDPAASAADRLVRIDGGERNGWGAFGLVLSREHAYPQNNVGNVTIRDLELAGGYGRYGYGLMMGNALDVTLDRVKIGDVAIALGTAGASANYVTVARDCTLNGSHCAVRLFYAIARLRDITSHRNGRHLARFLGASRVRADGWFAYGQDMDCQTIIYCGGGTQATILDLTMDFEDGADPQRPALAAIYAEAGGPIGKSAILRLDDLNFGTLKADRPIVLLGGPNPSGNTTTALFSLAGLNYASKVSPIVRVTSSLWGGDFSAAERLPFPDTTLVDWQAFGRPTVTARP